MNAPIDPDIQFIDRVNPILCEDVMTNEVREVLKMINQKIAAQESLDAIMNFIFDRTRDILPCDRIGLAFLDPDGRQVEAYWTRTNYEPLVLEKGYSELLAGSSLEYILESGKRRIINDLEAYSRKHPASISSRMLVEEGILSSMTCPLKVENRIVGLFFRSSRERNAFTPCHVQMHMSIAERLSQAVEKAYQFEQLSHAMENYQETLSFIAHELKSPVSSIVMDCNVLLGGYLGEVSHKQKKKIERIVLKSKHLLGLVRDYLDMARIESGEIQIDFEEDVDFMDDVLRPCAEIARAAIHRKAMELTVTKHVTPQSLTCDPNLFRIVVLNLLSNAVKYGFPVGEILVTAQQRPDTFYLSVKNEGPGFPEEEKKNLFRKFSRLNLPHLKKEEGTGLGLYTVWRVVQLHGGTIRAESKPGRWAEFIIEIPQGLPTD